MRALVTGGTGFLGANLVHHLLDQDDDVALLVRPAGNRWRIEDVAKDVTVIDGELGATADFAGAIQTWAPDVIYHLAWEGIHGGNRNDVDHVRRNICGALDLVEIAARVGCETWIGIGSQAEFGPSREPLRDDGPTRAITTYGVTKLAAGQLTGHLCRVHGIRHAWLRLLSAYGPMDEPTYLIPYIIGELLAGRTPELSEGSQLHDTLHARDVASALRMAAASPNCAGPLVLCSGTARSVREIATTIRDLAAPQTELVFGTRGVVTTGLSGVPARLHTMTAWSATVTLAEGLRETVDWHRAAAVGATS